jgi:hypothetical protein
VFPRPLLCPACGGSDLIAEPVSLGVLEDVTTHRGATIGAVRVALGPVLVARLEDGVQRGDEVELSVDGDVPVAGRRS